MQAQSVFDIPHHVLKKILELVPGSQFLRTRMDLALVCKRFALAVEELQAVTLSKQDLTGKDFALTQTAKTKMARSLRHVTQLQLELASDGYRSCLFGMVRCCAALHTLTIKVRLDRYGPSMTLIASLGGYLWSLLRQYSAELKQLDMVKVLSTDGDILLHVAAVGGCLDGLANVTEGHLGLLQSLTKSANGNKPDRSNARLHDILLKLMPSLQVVSGIGPCDFCAPFDRTIGGHLEAGTVTTFQQASTSHCIGCVCFPSVFPAIDSIKTWKGTMLGTDQAIHTYAPKLEVLDVKIKSPFGSSCETYHAVLTPFLTSIDIRLFRSNGPLLVHGFPSSELMHLRLRGGALIIEESLFQWLKFRFGAALTVTASALETCTFEHHVYLHSSHRGSPVSLSCHAS